MHQLLGFAVILVLIFSPIRNNLDLEERTDFMSCMLTEGSLCFLVTSDSRWSAQAPATNQGKTFAFLGTKKDRQCSQGQQPV